MQDQSFQRFALEGYLHEALEKSEFKVYYQPLVTAQSKTLAGFEALLRWDRPGHGIITPDQFIPVAENTGLIIDIGTWVLRTVCAQASQWLKEGLTHFQVGINVSPRQFRGDTLLNSIHECLSEYQLPATVLHIEVTEGLLIRNTPEVCAILDNLSELGIGITMDDFGTGYSSLSYLKRYPFDTIKIDREFIHDISNDEDTRVLVIAAIRMGKALGLTVVAEGVETEEQFEFLAKNECDLIQGYLVGRPAPAESFRSMAND